MSQSTGYYDSDGIPIHVGDLIRVKHYKHRRGKRQMWIYFRVAIHPLSGAESDHGRYVVQNWSDLDTSKWRCLLRDCELDGSEVLDQSGCERNGHGCLVTFNERKREAKQ
jgi:hypothetical protein